MGGLTVKDVIASAIDSLRSAGDSESAGGTDLRTLRLLDEGIRQAKMARTSIEARRLVGK